MYDPYVGRFFKVDKLASRCSCNNPYAFSENVAINSNKLEGLEAEINHSKDGVYPDQQKNVDI